MGATSIIIDSKSLPDEATTFIELSGNYLVGVGVSCIGSIYNVLEFRAVVFLTQAGKDQGHIVCGLCQGIVGSRSIIGWTGKIPITDDMWIVCQTRGNTVDNAFLGCVTEDN